jgi:hypothetical protein
MKIQKSYFYLYTAVLASTLLISTHSSVASIKWARQISNVDEITKDDPEFGYKHGALFHNNLKHKNSSAYLQTLIQKPEANFALRRYEDKRRSGFLGFFEKPLSDIALLNSKFFSKDLRYKHILNKGPTLQFLLGEPTGVSEGYTVGEHSSRLLDVYEDQKLHYFPAEKQPAYQISMFDAFMKDLLVFHDIGKSIGFKANGKNTTETEYSTPFIGIFLESMGYKQNEVILAQSLIDAHKIIGDYLKAPTEIALKQAAQKIKEAASKTHLSVSLYYDLLEMLFICDAGSYPGLQANPNIFSKDKVTQKLAPANMEARKKLLESLQK